MGSVGKRRRNGAPTLLHPPGTWRSGSNPSWGSAPSASIPRRSHGGLSPLLPKQSSATQLCAHRTLRCPWEHRAAPRVVTVLRTQQALAEEDREQEELAATALRSTPQTPTEPKPPHSPRGAPKLKHAALGALGAGNSSPVQVTKPPTGDKATNTAAIHRSIPAPSLRALLRYTVSMATACTIPPRSPPAPSSQLNS